jgi:hypothetical protein
MRRLKGIPRVEFDIQAVWENNPDGEFLIGIAPLCYVFVIRILDPRINLAKGVRMLLAENKREAESFKNHGPGKKGAVKQNRVATSSGESRAVNQDSSDSVWSESPTTKLMELSQYASMFKSISLMDAYRVRNKMQQDTFLETECQWGSFFDPCVLLGMHRSMPAEGDSSYRTALSLHFKELGMSSQRARTVMQAIQGSLIFQSVVIRKPPDEYDDATNTGYQSDRYAMPKCWVRAKVLWMFPRVFLNSRMPHIIDSDDPSSKYEGKSKPGPGNPFPRVVHAVCDNVESRMESTFRKEGIFKKGDTKEEWILDSMHRVEDADVDTGYHFSRFEQAASRTSKTHPEPVKALYSWLDEHQSRDSEFSLFPRTEDMGCMPLIVDPEMTIFSNWAAACFLMFEHVFYSEGAHLINFEILHTALSVYQMAEENPGVFICGETSVGKSKIMKDLALVLIPGTTETRQSRTERSKNTTSNQDAMIIMEHEADGTWFTSEKSPEGNNVLKGIMSETCTQHEVMEWLSDGTRINRKITTQHRNTYLVLTNQAASDMSDSMRSRFSIINMQKTERKNNGRDKKKLLQQTATDGGRLMGDMSRIMQCIQFFQSQIGLLIHSKAIVFNKQTNLAAFEVVLARLRINNPDLVADRALTRARKMAYDLMLKRVWFTICCGLNKDVKAGERFTYDCFKRVAPHLYMAEEDAWQALSLYAKESSSSVERPLMKHILAKLDSADLGTGALATDASTDVDAQANAYYDLYKIRAFPKPKKPSGPGSYSRAPTTRARTDQLARFLHKEMQDKTPTFHGLATAIVALEKENIQVRVHPKYAAPVRTIPVMVAGEDGRSAMIAVEYVARFRAAEKKTFGESGADSALISNAVKQSYPYPGISKMRVAVLGCPVMSPIDGVHYDAGELNQFTRNAGEGQVKWATYTHPHLLQTMDLQDPEERQPPLNTLCTDEETGETIILEQGELNRTRVQREKSGAVIRTMGDVHFLNYAMRTHGRKDMPTPGALDEAFRRKYKTKQNNVCQFPGRYPRELIARYTLADDENMKGGPYPASPLSPKKRKHAEDTENQSSAHNSPVKQPEKKKGRFDLPEHKEQALGALAPMPPASQIMLRLPGRDRLKAATLLKW